LLPGCHEAGRPRKQTVLNIPKHPKHKIFQQELAALYKRSRERKIATFVTELDDILPKYL